MPEAKADDALPSPFDKELDAKVEKPVLPADPFNPAQQFNNLQDENNTFQEAAKPAEQPPPPESNPATVDAFAKLEEVRDLLLPGIDAEAASSNLQFDLVVNLERKAIVVMGTNGVKVDSFVIPWTEIMEQGRSYKDTFPVNLALLVQKLK